MSAAATDRCAGQIWQSGEGKIASNTCPPTVRDSRESQATAHRMPIWGEVVSLSGECAVLVAEVDPREELIRRYAETAASLAEPTVHQLGEGGEWFADLIGLPGAWATGQTPWEALTNFKGVVYDWASMKLSHGDRDVPPLADIDLTIFV